MRKKTIGILDLKAFLGLYEHSVNINAKRNIVASIIDVVSYSQKE